MKRAPVILVSCSLLAGACTHRLTDFTILSTKNLDLSRVHELKRRPARVTGSDAVYIFLFIPTGLAPNMKDAVDQAIESVSGGVALVNGVLRHRSWYFLFGENRFIVEGEVLWDPKLGDGSIRKPAPRASREDTSGS